MAMQAFPRQTHHLFSKHSKSVQSLRKPHTVHNKRQMLEARQSTPGIKFRGDQDHSRKELGQFWQKHLKQVEPDHKAQETMKPMRSVQKVTREIQYVNPRMVQSSYSPGRNQRPNVPESRNQTIVLFRSKVLKIESSPKGKSPKKENSPDIQGKNSPGKKKVITGRALWNLLGDLKVEGQPYGEQDYFNDLIQIKTNFNSLEPFELEGLEPTQSMNIDDGDDSDLQKYSNQHLYRHIRSNYVSSHFPGMYLKETVSGVMRNSSRGMSRAELVQKFRVRPHSRPKQFKTFKEKRKRKVEQLGGWQAD